ncbi:MAG: hypothetical protein PHX61_14870 [Alphaproteobacteria bacterium]|nr:hypothetical protein [Alphaproteobacteria bacterium]
MKEKLALVPIVGDYYMAADGTQFVLVKHVIRTKRGSTETYDDDTSLGYFTTIGSLLKKLAKDYISDEMQSGALRSIRDVIREYDSITSRLEDVVSF